MSGSPKVQKIAVARLSDLRTFPSSDFLMSVRIAIRLFGFLLKTPHQVKKRG